MCIERIFLFERRCTINIVRRNKKKKGGKITVILFLDSAEKSYNMKFLWTAKGGIENGCHII